MININFWLSQLFGIEALLLLLISYRKKNTNQILIFQTISALCYMIQYFLLGAFSGLLICSIEFIRDILYYKTNKDNFIYLLTIPFYILIGVFTFKNVFNLLPILASIIDGYALTKNKKIIVISSIVSYLIWLIYDFIYNSYSGMLTSIIVIISNISILLFHKDANITSQINFSKRK